MSAFVSLLWYVGFWLLAGSQQTRPYCIAFNLQQFQCVGYWRFLFRRDSRGHCIGLECEPMPVDTWHSLRTDKFNIRLYTRFATFLLRQQIEYTFQYGFLRMFSLKNRQHTTSIVLKLFNMIQRDLGCWDDFTEVRLKFDEYLQITGSFKLIN